MRKNGEPGLWGSDLAMQPLVPRKLQLGQMGDRLDAGALVLLAVGDCGVGERDNVVREVPGGGARYGKGYG
jgi:hypothetical protein